MIHVLTVHWKSTRWIEPQLAYIRRHTRADYRVVAAVDPTIGAAWHDRFARVLVTPVVSHAEKLNLLAGEVCKEASDGDWLVFIDSDCFPIADWVPQIESHLARHPLVAVRRDENGGDRQPHPCFCVTTVGFWKALGGDWRAGHQWQDAKGRAITDVGGNLLGQLEQAGIGWTPLLRTNRVDLHVVFFAVYGGIVYHHGAGSREPACRADDERLRARLPTVVRRGLHLLKLYNAYLRRHRARTGRMGEAIFEQLTRDPEFSRQVTDEGRVG